MDLSIFKCISCDNEYNIQEIRYRCDCGELLEVLHDLKSTIPNPQTWKKSLDSNMATIAFSRYKSLLFPSLPDTALITLSEGDTKHTYRVLDNDVAVGQIDMGTIIRALVPKVSDKNNPIL